MNSVFEIKWNKKWNSTRILLWVFASLVSVLTSNSYIYYFVFALQVALLFRQSKGISLDSVYLLLYSCLLPNNYIPRVFELISGFILLRSGKINRKYALLFFSIMSGFVLSAVLNAVPIVNICFAVLYLMPSLILMINYKNAWNEQYSEAVSPLIDEIFIILTCSTIINLFGKIIGIQRAIPGDDWSTGTFGDGQGNPLFMIIAIIFLARFELIIKKPLKYVWFIIAAVFMLLASHSYALLLAFILAVGIGIIKTYGIKKSLKIFSPFLIVFILFIHLRHFDLIIINALSNKDYLFGLFPKLRVILAAFAKIPGTSIIHFLFGVGPGEFSSRAAATCTGLYVNSYNRFFAPSVGKWMSEYVYERIYQGFLDSGGNGGSILSLPYSSAATVIGEYGIWGVVSYFFIFKNFVKGKSKSAGIIVVFFIVACFLDNWLEYIKVVTFLTVCLCICNTDSKASQSHLTINKKA